MCYNYRLRITEHNYGELALPSPALPGRRSCPVLASPMRTTTKCSKVFSNQQTHISKWVLRRFATSCDVFAMSQIRHRLSHRAACRIANKMTYKSAFKPFITLSVYNHRTCPLNVYGSTGNKQTNKCTLAFYKGIDGMVT